MPDCNETADPVQQVPVITLNVSDFIAACTRPAIADNGIEFTALDGLADILAFCRTQSKYLCRQCVGKGTVVDPFDENDRQETCPTCSGEGYTLFVTLPESYIKNVRAAVALVEDLRAALEYAKGGPNS